MYKKNNLPPAMNVPSYSTIIGIITKYIYDTVSLNEDIKILEAGCGRKWHLSLQNLNYSLTGVDLDDNSINIRRNIQKDLDVAIVGDLRTVSLEPNTYNIIYNENVLEHIDGAEVVLLNFVRWLKPGGIMILLFPNRDSAYSFITRKTPFWLHVFLIKYLEGNKNAGKPGYDPYPVYFDKVVSRNGIYEFCKKNGLVVKAEFRRDGDPIKNRIIWFIAKVLLWVVYLLSFTKLSLDYKTLVYIIEKPDSILKPNQ